MSLGTWIFNIFLILLYFVTGFYITQCSVYLNNYTSSDVNIATAYKYAFSASFIPWTLLGIFIVVLAGFIIVTVQTGGADLKAAQQSALKSGGWATIFFIIMLVLITITGILSAAAAHNIGISSTYAGGNADVALAYRDAIISASVCIGIVILIIGALIYLYWQSRQPEEIKETKTVQ